MRVPFRAALAVGTAAVLLGAVAGTNASAPAAEPDLGDPVGSLSCLPSDQVLIWAPYGPGPGDSHPSPSSAVQAFLVRYPGLSSDLFAVDYADGSFEQWVLDVVGHRKAIVRLAKVDEEWFLAEFAACNALLVEGLR